MSAEIYGTRARIGVVLPADNVVTEPELNASRLDGVSFHFARLATEERSLMRENGIRCAQSLALGGIDVLAYACSETSAVGADTSEAFIDRLADAARAPAVTATAAIAARLTALGCRRLVLLTPYLANYGVQVEHAYAERGFEVVRAVHRHVASPPGLSEWWATNRQSPLDVRALAESADVGGADAVVLPATNVPALPVVDEIAAKLGVPVVTGNAALASWCLAQVGLGDDASGLAVSG